MDAVRFRETLRELRKELVGSQAALSARTQSGQARPVNVMTISEIETGAIADPGIVTVARIVEGMGLTLSSFFARIEGLVLPAADDKARPWRPQVADHESLPKLPSEAEMAEAAFRFIADIAARHGALDREAELIARDQLAADSRDQAAELRPAGGTLHPLTARRPKKRRSIKRRGKRKPR